MMSTCSDWTLTSSSSSPSSSSSVGYERTHLCRRVQSVPNSSLCVSEFHEKCPAASDMKVWNCRLLFALGLVPQKLFLLLLTERPDGCCRRSPRPPAALIAFVSRSPPIYCCNFSNFSGLIVWRQKAPASAALWEMYIKLRWEKHKGNTPKSSHCHAQRAARSLSTPPDATSSNE